MRLKYSRMFIDSGSVAGYLSLVAPLGRPLNHSNANWFTHLALPCALAIARGVTHGGATFKTMTQELIDELRAWINYDPDTGVLTWRKLRSSRALEGTECGNLLRRGYRQIRFKGRIHQAHRVAFALYHGRWPNNEIDHINRVKDDNRISNLREATPSENQCNRALRRDNTSGVIGVCWDKKRGKWYAIVMLESKVRSSKYFTSLDEAAEWVRRKRAELHGEFATQH